MIRKVRERDSRSSSLEKASKLLIDLNRKLLDQNEKLLKDKEELIEKEIYLLKMVNDAMKVTEPKRFLAHRMSIAPFEPIDEKLISSEN